MLLLTREETKSIKIGDAIVISISRIRGDRARVVVAAPNGMRTLHGKLASHMTRFTTTDSDVK